MRVETNTALIKRNRRNANILFFFSIAVLIAGFLLANLQLTATDETSLALSVFLPWLILPVGFVATLASVRMTNLWLRRPRPETAIQEGLKGISSKSVLYHYYHFPARHVLIAPQGVFAMITRFQEGRFSVEGDKWQTAGGPFGRIIRFLRRDDIGNPTEEARQAAAYVQKLINTTLPDVEVQPLIIFVDPRAQLSITNPTVPVLFADENKTPNLRDYMRDLAAQMQQEKQSPTQPKKKGEKEKPKSGPSLEAIADALEAATLL